MELSDVDPEIRPRPFDLLELDAALDKLAAKYPRAAELVKLRFFAGLTMEQAAAALGVCTTTADDDWAFAKGWLRVELFGSAQQRVVKSDSSEKNAETPGILQVSLTAVCRISCDRVAGSSPPCLRGGFVKPKNAKNRIRRCFVRELVNALIEAYLHRDHEQPWPANSSTKEPSSVSRGGSIRRKSA